MEVVKEGDYVPTANDSCIKMGSDESHFNVSLIVKDKVTKQCLQTTTFKDERRVEADSNRGPTAYQPNALPPGQTGSHVRQDSRGRKFYSIE